MKVNTEHFSPAETALWQKLLMKNLNEKITSLPGIPVCDVYSDTYKEFLDQKWVCLVEKGKYNLTQEDYQKLGSEFGPDLTGISRSRYSYLKGASNSSSTKAGSSTPKKMSAYNNFIKEIRAKDKTIDFKKAAEIWGQMTPEEKKKYNQNE